MRTRRIIMLEVAKYYQRMENRELEKRKAEERPRSFLRKLLGKK